MGSSQAPRESSGRKVATAVASPTPAKAPRIERDLTAWKSFLRAEDRRCEELRLHAVIVTVGLALPRDLAPACAALESVLGATDRICVLCEDELSVLLVPVDDIHHARRTVERLDAALHAAGIVAHVGWAMRHDGHGLFHAAARADAAMLTAKGHGHLSVDLSKR